MNRNSEQLTSSVFSPEVDAALSRFKEASLAALAIQLQAHRTTGYPAYEQRYRHPSPAGNLTIPRGPWQAGEQLPQAPDYIAIRRAELPTDSWHRPVHPWLQDMARHPAGVASGKGCYYRWGPNYTADPIIIQNNHILLVRRGLDGMLALPGGFVDAGESAEQAARRETQEETGILLPDTAIATEIYRGPVADIRMTAHAWPETTALLFMLPDTAQLPWAGGDETMLWKPLETALEADLYGSHRQLIELALPRLLVSGTAYPQSGG